jgi:ElaB/YqjD/DUF883 family membrane-anchored ribosome-binding protein
MNSPSVPPEILERRAAEQRRRLHESVEELKSTVRDEVRDRLDVNRYTREYFWQTAGTVSLIGLMLGYGFAGMFTRR